MDDLRIRVNAGSQEHGTASNAKAKDTRRGLLRRFGLVESEPISLAVHRLDSLVYYRRLEAGEFHLLGEIRQGRPIAAAIESTLERLTTKLADTRAIQGVIEGWFSTWAELGWLCEYPESEPKEQGDYDRSGKAA